VTIYKEGYMPI
jgi:hypothetical protein